jgi:2-polyprenyl-3-methyl-5-hydroxy-6-metoxy-1,4-benzoquinol methylase
MMVMHEEIFGYDYFHGKGSNYPKQGYHVLEREIRQQARRVVNYVLGQRSKTGSLKWLDVGCAYGFFVYEAYNMGIDAYGVDISAYAINEGKKIFPCLKNRLFTCDCNKLTSIFHPETFEVISMFEIVEHQPDPQFALTEIKELLKPRGILLLTTPKPEYYLDDKDVTHINVHSLKYWKQILRSLNFRVSYPCLFYDTSKEGHPLIRTLSRIQTFKKIYSTIKASITKTASYQIYAVKI